MINVELLPPLFPFDPNMLLMTSAQKNNRRTETGTTQKQEPHANTRKNWLLAVHRRIRCISSHQPGSLGSSCMDQKRAQGVAR